jgi:hypothetical protein
VIVWTDDALFAGPHHDLERLALLRNAARRRHTLIVSKSPAEPWGRRTAPNFDAWLAGLPKRLQWEIKQIQERLEIVSVTSVTRGAQRVLVCDRDLGGAHVGCQLSLDDAVRALSLPLCLVVEHQLHDGAFIRRVLPPAWRVRFAEWERRGELRYENGCGISVISALVEYHCDDERARLAFGLPSEIWRLLHFIVFDHDGDSADIPGLDSGGLGRICNKVGMEGRWYRLRRRDQEHYLPIPALRKIVNERITDPADREQRLASIDAHAAKGERRHFDPLPQLADGAFLKRAFKDEGESWSDQWFEEDDAWPEMTRLAEQIASAM